MNDSIKDWQNKGAEYGYSMPAAPRWKRLPIIRHVRTIAAMIAVERHYRLWAGIGIRTGADDWVLWGMWRGMERDP